MPGQPTHLSDSSPETSRYCSLRRELRTLTASTAHLSLYAGLNETDEELGLTGTNLWIYPGFDHDENVLRFAGNPELPFPVVYISFPSSKDPDFSRRHPGKSTIDVITLLPYDAFERWGGQHTVGRSMTG
jgi:all-trans-retinol 13,14-reductase